MDWPCDSGTWFVSVIATDFQYTQVLMQSLMSEKIVEENDKINVLNGSKEITELYLLTGNVFAEIVSVCQRDSLVSWFDKCTCMYFMVINFPSRWYAETTLTENKIVLCFGERTN